MNIIIALAWWGDGINAKRRHMVYPLQTFNGLKHLN